MDKYTEYETEIAGNKVKIFHGVVYINGRQLNFLEEFENNITDVIIDLIKRGK